MKLTDAQYQINRQTSIQTDATNEWLKHNGIKLNQFNTTKPRILLAQQTAHRLLTEHQAQLTNTQTKTLRHNSNSAICLCVMLVKYICPKNGIK